MKALVGEMKVGGGGGGGGAISADGAGTDDPTVSPTYMYVRIHVYTCQGCI